MTYPASPYAATGWKSLRSGLTFTTREDEVSVRRARLRRRSGPKLWIAAASAVLIVAAALAVLSQGATDGVAPAPARPAPEAPPAPSAPVWTEVVHPFVAYDLAGGYFAKLPLRYTARRDHAGGAREDVLAYGDLRPGSAFLNLAFLRRGDAPAVEVSLFVEAARLAAAAGLAVTRSGLGAQVNTRFGPFEVAEVDLDGNAVSASCLAFRLTAAEATPVLRLAGLACGTVKHPIDQATLACTLDRIDIVSAGDDEALRDIFVAAERKRGDGCSGGHAPTPAIGWDAGRRSRNGLKGSM